MSPSLVIPATGSFVIGAPTSAQMVPYMQQAWKDIGADMAPSNIPFTTSSEIVNAGDYEMSIGGFGFPDDSQGLMYCSDSVYPQGFNLVKWSNAEYDQLDDLQARELDDTKRIDLLIEQANIVAAELPNAPLVFSKGLAAASPRVHNFYPTGNSSLWSIPWMWVDA